MVTCTSCGVENADNTQFCTKCGAAIPSSSQSSSSARPPSAEYIPTGGAGTYNQPQSPLAYGQPQQVTPEPMNPILPAIVSLFIPGAGMFFIPGKAGLGAIFLVAWICYLFIFIVLAMFVVGLCLIPVTFIIHIGSALYSYDLAAKESGGKYQPVLFK